jgi:hypothetical protein
VSDTLHLIFSALTVLFMALSVGFSAAAFGRRFRYFAIAALAVMLGFGGLTAAYVDAVEADLPTPWLGVWERISIIGYLAWVVGLTLLCWRRVGRHRSSQLEFRPQGEIR